MQVRELISKLNKYNPDADIRFISLSNSSNIEKFSISDDYEIQEWEGEAGMLVEVILSRY